MVASKPGTSFASALNCPLVPAMIALTAVPKSAPLFALTSKAVCINDCAEVTDPVAAVNAAIAGLKSSSTTENCFCKAVI